MDNIIIRKFIKVLTMISAAVLFGILHLFIGMYLGWAFWGDSIMWQNIVYYIFFAGTAALLVWFLVKKFKTFDEL